MPLTPAFTIVQDDGGATATATNTTADYGTGGNQNRNDAAEFVLWSKTDADGNRVFTNPDQGNVLTKLIYSVATAVSGLYELIWLRIQPYDPGTAYVPQVGTAPITQYPSIVYYPTTGLVYKCIAASTGNLPTDTDFWEEVPLASLYTLLGNDTLDEFIENFDSTYTINKCITKKLAANGCACSSEDRDYTSKLFSLLVSANSNYNEGNIYKFQEIIAELNTLCVACS